MNKRGFLQISFAWIFAILVGGFIIFLAISATGKIKDSRASGSDIEASKELGILLSPLEAGFEEIKTSSFEMPKESKLIFRCNTYDDFGTQGIIVRGENFDEFSGNNMEIEFPNKYIFSEKVLEERNFNLFSKKFSFPFKTATLIYITPSSKDYCFIDAPSEIEEEIENMKGSESPQYIFQENCSTKDMVQVCFRDEGCDINVNYNLGELEKEGEIFFFQGDALMYAAIFSEKGIYDCQVQRLMKKVGILSDIYIEKSIVNPRSGCLEDVQTINGKLRLLEEFTEGFESPEDLSKIQFLIQEIEQNNDRLRSCKLW